MIAGARKVAQILAMVLAAMMALGACRGDRERGGPAVLREGDVARVGDLGIPESLVGAVARARSLSTREALNALVDDSLLANDARARGLDVQGGARWAEVAALSRRVLDQVRRDAREQGPPSADELATLTVVHAVVVRSTILTDNEAAGLANAIRDAVRGSRGASDFEKRASGVAHPNARVVVERLALFGADGVMATGDGLDPTFVAAAFALKLPNEVSAVVETPFGWHVLLLIDRLVPDGATLAQRREQLAPAVMTLRARMAQGRTLDACRARERVEIASSAAALMAAVPAERE